MNPWRSVASESAEFYPLLCNEKVILLSDCLGQPCLKAINWKTGEEHWSLKHSTLDQIFYNCIPFLNDSSLVLPLGRELICVNIDNGSIRWKYRDNHAGDVHVFGNETHCYRSYRGQQDTSFRLLQFDLASGIVDTFSKYPVRKASTSILRSPVPVNIEDTSILVSSVIDHLPKESTESYLLEWPVQFRSNPEKYPVYKKNKKGLGAALPPVVYGYRSYWVAHNQVLCFDHASKTTCWQKSLPKGILTSRLTRWEDKLYIAIENEILYALDLKNGSVQWQVPISGTPGRLFHTQQDIWLIGGADRLLYRVNRQEQTVSQRYKLSGSNKILQRASLITSDFILISDGEYWHAYPINEMEEHLTKLELIKH